jgi:hypothetical protein
MNAYSKILLAATLVAGAGAPAFAQASDLETTSASVRIIQPIALSQAVGNTLSFGTIIRASSGDNTFTIAPGANTIVKTGAGNGEALASSTISRATYTASGEGGQAFSFSLSTLQLTGPGSPITVALTPTFTSGSFSGTLGSAGAFQTPLFVGGAITIASTQASGDYSGSFTATLAYN